MPECSIVWFRNDLRLSDNPAFSAAAALGKPIICLYIDDTENHHGLAVGAASRWWLHHSLKSLQKKLRQLGGSIVLKRGDPVEIIGKLAQEQGATSVYWNRLYEPWTIDRDSKLKADLQSKGIAVETFAASLLREPWEVKTKTGGPYGVFTPFWKTLSAMAAPDLPLPAPKTISFSKAQVPSDTLDELVPLPSRPNWAVDFPDHWTPGETGAQQRLQEFIENGISTYKNERNNPSVEFGTSRLSPHLHFGEISARQVWHIAQHAIDSGEAEASSAWAFLREIGWRDFNHHLLFHNPDIPSENYKPAFDAFPWCSDDEAFTAWTKGQTGYPFVDAGMRELWHSGFMHNRVRMVAASFLIKHLLIDWRRGEQWFRDTLVDADLANNANGWQWVAGSGADAAPYFRIFNPITQGEKFDPTGAYIRRWVPELAELPDTHLFKPWEAPPFELRAANIELGKTYPLPIVDHAMARQRALAALAETKSEPKRGAA